MGVSDRTLQFYKERLSKVFSTVDCTTIKREKIQNILNSIPPNKYGLGTRHASYRALKTFYRWLELEYGITNPMIGLPAPILGKPILPTLTKSQVTMLIKQSYSPRDKAIIALFTESGLRLGELAGIKLQDIDWANRTIRTWGKNRKEAYAPFGQLSEKYLKLWLLRYKAKKNIWGISESGIYTMLRRLKDRTGLPCNPHSFRRTFACLLRKAGVDCLVIKDLGRWESVEMVNRYTRSMTFHDSLKFYRAPLD
jgi:site-specific recombinase XerD